MTTTDLLLLALVVALLLLAVVVVATRTRRLGPPGNELVVADRLAQMQAAMGDSLARATKEMADQRAASAEQVRKLEVAMVEQKAAATEAQRKQEVAFLERMTKFEKGVHESVTAAKKEVTTSKEAIDKNAAEMAKVMASLGETLGKLSTQQEAATRISEDLKFVLQGTKSRGDFGETILEELLERTVPGIWKAQVTIEGREAVDAGVTLKDVVYPIDAKFPKEDYQRFLRAETEVLKADAWRAHVGAVRAQIDSIERKYVKPEAGTSQFALMFIPSEGMYYDTVRDTDPFGEPSGLMEYAYAQRVIPVSPTTLFAFLMVISKAQEGQRLVDGVHDLMGQLEKVRRGFELFYAKYEAMGKGIDKAHEAWRVGDGHIQRFKENVDEALDYDLSLLPGPPSALQLPGEAPPTSPVVAPRAMAEVMTPHPPARPTARIVEAGKERDTAPRSTSAEANGSPDVLNKILQEPRVPTAKPAGTASLPAKPKNKAAFKVED